jgi:hypothetical protein
MRYLLDKNVVRYCVRGLLGDLRQDDVRFSLHLLLTPSPGELFISLETVHILEHIVAMPQRRAILRRTSPLFPTRYTRRWARRLREANFDREDAYLLSLASFSTDRLKEGRILGVDVFVTCDLVLQAHYQSVQSTVQKRLQRMTAQLPPPYNRAIMPQVQTPRSAGLSLPFHSSIGL